MLCEVHIVKLKLSSVTSLTHEKPVPQGSRPNNVTSDITAAIDQDRDTNDNSIKHSITLLAFDFKCMLA